MNSFKQVITKRRSIRNFSKMEISKDIIVKIIRASMQAPSAKNQQPWEFLVVRNKEKLNKCSEVLSNCSMVKDCDCVIVYLTDKRDLKAPDKYPQDLSAAIENALLKATSLKIGSCWCGIYPNEDRMNKVREVFEIDKDYLEPFAVVAFGYPRNPRDLKYYNRYKEEKIHFEVL